jgi:outer membrane protein assembly factor BamB
MYDENQPRSGKANSMSPRLQSKFSLLILQGILQTTILVFASVRSPAADWPHWRGPNRNSIVTEQSGYANGKWPVSKPAWTANVGIGSSSPLIIGDKLYVTGWRTNRDTLTCLDTKTSRVIWTQSSPAPKYGRHSTGDKRIYAGPSSTPEFDPKTQLIYTLSLDGHLQCRNTKTKGRLVWETNLYDKYAVKRRPNVGKRKNRLRDYGYTSSPLVYQNVLLVEVGSSRGTVIAFDKQTGNQRWASECRDEAGHTGGPVFMTVQGVPCAALLTLRNLIVFRLDKGNEGKTIATHKWTTDFANNIPTPAVSGDSVIITSAYNHYAMRKVKITLQGASQLWETKNPSGVCSPIIHKGHIYWAWRGVHCVDFKTGKQLWVGGKVGSAGSCLLTSDERLIVWANTGDLSLVETAMRSPKKYRELAKRPRIFRKDAWPHVVLANGRLFCKDRDGNLACFLLKQK